MSRLVDRGAVYAAMVGVGMATTIAVSFLLVIPIEPVAWLLGPLGAILIGYYANSRAGRLHGPWGRILASALFAGAVTGLTLAALLLAIKAIFFYADAGYRDAASGGPLTCGTGPACVYARYLAEGQGDELAAVGVTGVASFTSFYWGEQLRTAGIVIVLTTLGGLVGGALYGLARPKERPPP
jgi:hypothetical protein